MNDPFTKKAKEIASNPDLYNKAVCFSWFSKLKWECMGYSRTGKTIRFSRLIEHPEGRWKQIDKYVDPEEDVLIWQVS